ncbi:HEAT repeat-containing protein 3-like [Ptychodera flava]|uniref:HEAT repeat-containing protein 3-like n=1 Tax=Ptychodera flava TaxID=63121 RepID=UPI00396A032A
MGKSKNKMYTVKKPQPTGLCSVKDAETAKNELEVPPNATQTQTAAILEKLQSPEEEDRQCGCSSLAMTVFDEKMVQPLLENGIVKCAGPLLIDKCMAVREAAAGALRNLSISGGHKVCITMVEDDVMTPLVHLLNQCSENLKLVSENKTNKDPTKDIMVQSLHLLWNLCESSPVAVNTVSSESMICTIVECLKVDKYGIELAIPSAQCLHVVSEENRTGAQVLCVPEMLSVLESHMMSSGSSYRHCLLKTLIAGTLLNIKACLPSGMQSETVQAIVKVLSQTLEIDILEALQRFLTQFAATNGINHTDLDGGENSQIPVKDVREEDKDFKDKEERMEEIKCLLTSQQVALEIISNMCVPDDDDDDEEWEDMDATSSSSSDDQTEDMDITDTNSPFLSPLCLSAEIHSALIAQNVPKQILDKTSIADKNTTVITSHPKGQILMKGLQTIQNRALICLHNMVSVVETESLGGNDALNKLWQLLLAQTFEKKDNITDEYVEAMTSAMRALLQKMAAGQQAPQGLTEDHLLRLCELSHSSECSNVRANILGILGSIGNLLAKQPNTNALLSAIGSHLINVLSKEPKLWVIAEALDAIFDTFGDGQVADDVALQICLVDKLKQMLPVLKSKIRQGRIHLKEHYPVVMNAKTNLVRFIKYKEDQMK